MEDLNIIYAFSYLQLKIQGARRKKFYFEDFKKASTLGDLRRE